MYKYLSRVELNCLKEYYLDAFKRAVKARDRESAKEIKSRLREIENSIPV